MYDVFYKYRYLGFSIFILSYLSSVILSDYVLYIFDISNFPGQQDKAQYVSQALYLSLEAIRRLSEYFVLSVFVFLSQEKQAFEDLYSNLLRVLRLFRVVLLISPLMFLFDSLALIIFISMSQFSGICGGFEIGISLLVLLFFYYTTLFLLAIKIFPPRIDKIRAPINLLLFIITVALVDIFIFDYFDSLAAKNNWASEIL